MNMLPKMILHDPTRGHFYIQLARITPGTPEEFFTHEIMSSSHGDAERIETQDG